MHLEGSAIAVAQVLQLPDQPSAGGTVGYIPLGGNGYDAPIAAYQIAGFQVIGDATGTSATLAVTMDPRYTSLVSYVTFSIAQATSADADFRATIARGTTFPTISASGAIEAVSSNVSSQEVTRTWEPAPAVLPGTTVLVPTLQVQFVNVDTDIYTMSSMIYIFNIRARETTPMGPLLWARGSR